jgi:hypothetical protein
MFNEVQEETAVAFLPVKSCSDDRFVPALNKHQDNYWSLKAGTCPTPFWSGSIC